ncbi:MAG: glutamate racemase [Parcubacteria group bacterium]|nr:glutamate racemase [Parcubacteria group bacterium]
MIGIFDSGIGGLTVVKQIFKTLPQHKIVYFGDTARLPYGTKSEEAIIQFSIQNTEFLIEKGAKVIVIACHTASSVAADILREKFPDVPIFDVAGSGLEKAANISRKKKIGIMGTAATIKSGAHEKFLKNINPDIKVYPKACPLLVPLIEEGWLKRMETRKILRYYLRPLKLKQIDILVLACTHYPLLYKAIDSISGKSVKVVDPAEELAQELKEFLEKNPDVESTLEKNGKKHKFYVSDVPYRFNDLSKKILGEKISVEKVDIS